MKKCICGCAVESEYYEWCRDCWWSRDPRNEHRKTFETMLLMRGLILKPDWSLCRAADPDLVVGHVFNFRYDQENQIMDYAVKLIQPINYITIGMIV